MQIHYESKIIALELQLSHKVAELHKKDEDIAWFSEELANTRLVVQEKEAEILKFPRIEEKIRSESERHIRNSIIDMHRKDVNRNRQLEDLKELQYWKAAAADLEQKLKKVSIQEEHLRRQRVQRKNCGGGLASTTACKSSASREEGCQGGNLNIERPASAPSIGRFIILFRAKICIIQYFLLKQQVFFTTYIFQEEQTL